MDTRHSVPSGHMSGRHVERTKRRAVPVADEQPAGKKRKTGQHNPRSGEGSGEPVGVTFAPLLMKSEIVSLSRDRKFATGHKGFRMLRASAGVNSGTWFVEFNVLPEQPPNAHFRLGWANECGAATGPVGFDQHSYAYRDVSGSRVHQSIVSAYGEAYGPGDVIGCMITFETPREELAEAEAKDCGASAGPADGVRQSRVHAAVARGAPMREVEGELYNRNTCRQEWGAGAGVIASAGVGASSPSDADAGMSSTRSGSSPGSPLGSEERGVGVGGPPNGKQTVNQRFWRSSIRFFKNGVDQGPAFVHLTRESRYYPAVSMFNGGTVRLHPGPTFTCPPNPLYWPAGSYRPLSEAEGVQAGEGAGGQGVYGLSAADLLKLVNVSETVQGMMFTDATRVFDNMKDKGGAGGVGKGRGPKDKDRAGSAGKRGNGKEEKDK